MANPLLPGQRSQRVVTYYPRRTNHILHLLLTIFTFGSWAIIWIIVLIANVSAGPRKVVTHVDTPAAGTLLPTPPLPPIDARLDGHRPTDDQLAKTQRIANIGLAIAWVLAIVTTAIVQNGVPIIVAAFFSWVWYQHRLRQVHWSHLPDLTGAPRCTMCRQAQEQRLVQHQANYERLLAKREFRRQWADYQSLVEQEKALRHETDHSEGCDCSPCRIERLTASLTDKDRQWLRDHGHEAEQPDRNTWA